AKLVWAKAGEEEEDDEDEGGDTPEPTPTEHAVTLGQTTDSTGGEDVTLTGAGSYDAGDTVSIQAEYDGPSGTNFEGWYDAASGGTKVSSNETYTFTMPDEDVALYAKYV
ncbi:MAG: InlB B-repeat-containing protein, partial [Bacteroidaceae bacterium]|nr:InlB B-repeat-containing protein [Bacteroidaceae bacterium]